MTVAVVTDSTACLPDELVREYQIRVVPLHVVLAGRTGREGVDVGPGEVARALEHRHGVTTSRPTPAEFAAVYRELLRDGAAAVVSVHLSGKMSGTVEAAQLAAAELAAAEPGGPVTVLDGGSTGMGLGFPVLAAAAAARDGRDHVAVVEAAERAMARTTTLFYVDSLEYLRAGGRIGAASALLGAALLVKPILHVQDGEVVVREKVRTASRALARLIELAVTAAGTGPADVAVHHLAAPERAAALARQLEERLPAVGRLVTAELGAVVGAHVGPGLAGVVIHRRT